MVIERLHSGSRRSWRRVSSCDDSPCELSNMRLLLSRFALVGKEHSPCGSHSRADQYCRAAEPLSR